MQAKRIFSPVLVRQYIAIPAALNRDVWVKASACGANGSRARGSEKQMQPIRQPVGHQAKANEWTAVP